MELLKNTGIKTPWWLVSFIIHLVFLVICSFYILQVPGEEDVVLVEMHAGRYSIITDNSFSYSFNRISQNTEQELLHIENLPEKSLNETEENVELLELKPKGEQTSILPKIDFTGQEAPSGIHQNSWEHGFKEKPSSSRSTDLNNNKNVSYSCRSSLGSSMNYNINYESCVNCSRPNYIWSGAINFNSIEKGMWQYYIQYLKKEIS